VAGVTLTLAIMRGVSPRAVIAAACAGVAAAATVAGCALPIVVVGGNTFAGLLLAYLVVTGLVGTTGWHLPDAWVHLTGWPLGGILASAAVLLYRE
jgi:hypothetical protein